MFQPVLFLAALLSVAALPGDDTRGAIAGPKPNPAMSPADGAQPGKVAADALAAAAKARREANGKKGEEKLKLLERAGAAYERVVKEFVDDKPARAEASFRAGEIWRTIKREEDARRCFAATAEVVEAPGLAARAWSELGHLARRAKEYDEALRCYARVLQVVPEQRNDCVRALTWQGRVLVDQHHEKEGHALLLAVGQRYPDHPVEDIRNVDDVAVDWIRAGRVDEARALVEDCLARHAPLDDGSDDAMDSKGDPQEDPVAKALGKMKARELLSAPPKDGK